MKQMYEARVAGEECKSSGCCCLDYYLVKFFFVKPKFWAFLHVCFLRYSK